MPTQYNYENRIYQAPQPTSMKSLSFSFPHCTDVLRSYSIGHSRWFATSWRKCDVIIILGPGSLKRCHLTSIGNPIVEIRRSYDRLISTMGFPILVRWHLYIESGPWCQRCPWHRILKISYDTLDRVHWILTDDANWQKKALHVGYIGEGHFCHLWHLSLQFAWRVDCFSKTEMTFWRNFCYWRHRKLSKLLAAPFI